MTKLNKELCRQSYLDVVEYSARLAAFATSSFSDIIGHGHYESRAAELAVRDIIFLSISLRRLVELTKQYGIIKSKEIACFTAHRVDGVLVFKESDHKFNAWEIVG